MATSDDESPRPPATGNVRGLLGLLKSQLFKSRGVPLKEASREDTSSRSLATGAIADDLAGLKGCSLDSLDPSLPDLLEHLNLYVPLPPPPLLLLRPYLPLIEHAIPEYDHSSGRFKAVVFGAIGHRSSYLSRILDGLGAASDEGSMSKQQQRSQETFPGTGIDNVEVAGSQKLHASLKCDMVIFSPPFTWNCGDIQVAIQQMKSRLFDSSRPNTIYYTHRRRAIDRVYRRLWGTTFDIKWVHLSPQQRKPGEESSREEPSLGSTDLERWTKTATPYFVLHDDLLGEGGEERVSRVTLLQTNRSSPYKRINVGVSCVFPAYRSDHLLAVTVICPDPAVRGRPTLCAIHRYRCREGKAPQWMEDV